MNDYLTFRKMITPVLIRGIFWLGMMVVLVQAIAMGRATNPLVGLFMLVLGSLVWRVSCELALILFRIHEALEEIRKSRE
jgi:hypothetical protein